MTDKPPILSEKMANKPPIISDKMKEELEKINKNQLQHIYNIYSGDKFTEDTIKIVIEEIKCPKLRPQLVYAILLEAIIRGEPIKITNSSIPCALLLPGKWNCLVEDVASLHMIFICCVGNPDDIFEEALRSLPEWYERVSNRIFKKHDLGLLLFENYYYKVLKKGKVIRLE